MKNFTRRAKYRKNPRKSAKIKTACARISSLQFSRIIKNEMRK
jgi:hypothetical protein